MPRKNESGGAAGAGGEDYRASVAAWIIAHGLAGRPLPGFAHLLQPRELWLEAGGGADDIQVGFEGGSTVRLQCKRKPPSGTANGLGPVLDAFREDVERGVEAIVLVTRKTGPLEHLQSALDARHRGAPRGLTAGEQDSLAAFDEAVAHWPPDLRPRLVAMLRCLFLDDEADNGIAGLLSALVSQVQNAEAAGFVLRALTTRAAARRLGGSMEWWANELAQHGVELLPTTLSSNSGTRSTPRREPRRLHGTPPFPPAHFVGRADSVRRITAVLRSNRGRVALVGMGGLGKTALALKVAEACQGYFAGGILWADVGVHHGGIPEVLRMWLRSLGRDCAGMEFAEQLGCLRIALTEQVKRVGRILLLLDDTNERTAKDLVAMLSYLPQGVAILTTTREGTVGVAIGATHFSMDPLERVQAVQLLEAISASPLVLAEQFAVDRLLSLLGDLPLAVELVGRQIAVRGCKSTFTIESLVSLLSTFNPDMLSFPGHRGVALSFALSYESLSEAEQLVFRGTGHFETTALDCASIAAVCAISVEDTEARLERLVRTSSPYPPPVRTCAG